MNNHQEIITSALYELKSEDPFTFVGRKFDTSKWDIKQWGKIYLNEEGSIVLADWYIDFKGEANGIDTQVVDLLIDMYAKRLKQALYQEKE